jgi:hypothetical protein
MQTTTTDRQETPASIRAFAYKPGDPLIEARIRCTDARRYVWQELTDGGALLLMTDYVKGGRYARYLLLDTPENRATVRQRYGGTVKPYNPEAQRKLNTAYLLGLIYDMPEHRLTTLDLCVRRDITRKQLDRLTEAGHLQYVDYSESDFAIAFWQVSRVSARAILDVDPPIRHGDFIKARGTACVGFVFGVGSIPFGRSEIEGYWIKNADGKDDFISADQAVLIG